MPFTTSAESLKAKLHLSDAKTPAIIGVCLAAIIALLLVGNSIVDLASPPGIEIVRDEAKTGEEIQGPDDGMDSAATLYVHVAGAVVAPGMYGLPAGSRVQAALEAAGGFAEDAANSQINLAREVVDGEQIVVPTVAEVEAASSVAGTGSSDAHKTGEGTSGQATTSSTATGKININTADATLLDTLPGIGASTADKIIADREANGSFVSIEDLKRVSGIGEKKYAQLIELICVG